MAFQKEDFESLLTFLQGKVQDPRLTLQIISILWLYSSPYTMSRTKIRNKLIKIYDITIKGKDLQKVLDELIEKRFLRHPGSLDTYMPKLKNPLIRDLLKCSSSQETIEIMESQSQDICMALHLGLKIKKGFVNVEKDPKTPGTFAIRHIKYNPYGGETGEQDHWMLTGYNDDLTTQEIIDKLQPTKFEYFPPENFEYTEFDIKAKGPRKKAYEF